MLFPNPFLNAPKPHGRTQLVNYGVHRQEVESRDGHNPGALGISGWKGMTWAGLRWMYRHGKLTTEKAEQIRELIAPRYSPKSQIHKGFPRADHQAHDLVTGVGSAQPAPKKGRSRKVDLSNRIAQLEAELKVLRAGE